jgi:hypothetical protein
MPMRRSLIFRFLGSGLLKTILMLEPYHLLGL